MHRLNVKSEPVCKRDSKRLELIDLNEIFFFEPMYANLSDADAKEGYIKFRAFESACSESNSQGLKHKDLMAHEKLSQLKDTSEKSNPSASMSSESGNDSIDDLNGDLPLPAGHLPEGDLPVVQRPLPYFS